MPFYLRKSISAGPFRFNLSKSGVGLSVGVRGLRFGTGPRGHYIHAGVNGFYYRASLGRAGQKVKPPPHRVETRTPPPHLLVRPSDNVEMVDIESGDVLSMTDARLQDVVGEINRKCGQIRLSSMLAWTSGGIALGTTFAAANPIAFVVVLPAYLLGRWLDGYRRTTVLFYNLEPDVADTYREFVDAFEAMAKCDKIWHISAAGAVLDIATWKRNAGATSIIKRSSISLGLQLPAVVRSNIEAPYVRVGKQDLYFLPDFVLVLDRTKAGAVTYAQLQVCIQQGRQIESERVPADARVVGQTWQHPNKNGGPDRRFAYNKQIPVCLYEELHLTSPSGLNELVVLSKLGMADAFASRAKALARYGPAESNRPPLIPPLVSQKQHERNAFAARKSSRALVAALAAACVAGIAGLMWQPFAAREVVHTTPAIVAPRVVYEIPPQAKPNAVDNAQSAKEITTGSVAKQESVAVPPPKDSKPRVRQQKDKHAKWMESCKRKCIRAKAVAGKRTEAFDWSQCYLLCLTEEPRN